MAVYPGALFPPIAVWLEQQPDGSGSAIRNLTVCAASHPRVRDTDLSGT